MLYRFFLLSTLIVFFAHDTAAQVSDPEDICDYRKIRQEGIQAMNRGEFPEATNRFWLALDCPNLEPGHDINQLIREVQSRWVAALQTQVNRAQEAEQAAKDEKAKAIAAKVAEEEARRLAEANADKARRNGLLAESLRLSLLSDVTRTQSQGQKEDAMVLAFLSLKLSEERDTFASAMRAFAQAVRDSMEERLLPEALSIRNLELLPGGKGILARAASGLYIVDSQTRAVAKLEASANLPDPSAASDDGSLVLAFEEDGSAKLWNKSTNQAADISGHRESILAGDFAPGNQAAITGSRDNTAKVWSPQGQETAVFTGHEANVYGVECSPDSRHFLTRSADGTVRIWNQQGQSLAVLSDDAGYIYDAGFSPNGKEVFTAGASGLVKKWSLQGQLLATCEGHKSPAKQIIFLKQGQRILTRSEDAIKLWGGEGQLLGTMAHSGPIAGLHLSQDSTLAVTWEEGPQAILWDTEGTRMREFTGHQGIILSAELSPDGQMLLTTATDGTAKLWNRDGHILIDWDLRSDQPAPALFSADGQYVYTAQDENQALVACPTPYRVFERMKAGEDALGPKIEELQQRYNIQFLE